jgi:hypothetical protein
MSSATEALLAAIDAFLTETGMAETTFGLRALKDGKFVGRIRAGSGITLKTNDRVLAYIASERARMSKAAAEKEVAAAPRGRSRTFRGAAPTRLKAA